MNSMMRRAKRLALLVTMTILACSTTAVAQEADDGATNVPDPNGASATKTPEKDAVKKRLTFLLSGYEYFPSRSDLDEVAEPSVVSQMLRGFVEDDNLRPSLRLRAVDALAYYDDDANVAFLRKLVARPTKTMPPKRQRVEGLVRHHAITSLAKIEEEGVLDELEPFLAGDDLQLKLTAISAIGKHGGAAGKERLQRLVETVKDAVVKRELRKHLN